MPPLSQQGNPELPPTDLRGHLGGEVGYAHIVTRDDSNGPGGSSVPTDPSLTDTPAVEMIANSDRDDDDRY